MTEDELLASLAMPKPSSPTQALDQEIVREGVREVLSPTGRALETNQLGLTGQQLLDLVRDSEGRAGLLPLSSDTLFRRAAYPRRMWGSILSEKHADSACSDFNPSRRTIAGGECDCGMAHVAIVATRAVEGVCFGLYCNSCGGRHELLVDLRLRHPKRGGMEYLAYVTEHCVMPQFERFVERHADCNGAVRDEVLIRLRTTRESSDGTQVPDLPGIDDALLQQVAPIMDRARERMAEGLEVPPHLALCYQIPGSTPGVPETVLGVLPIMLALDDVPERLYEIERGRQVAMQQAMIRVGHRALGSKLLGAALITEAWQARYRSDDPGPITRPSDLPEEERHEVLVLSLFGPTHGYISTSTIERRSDTPFAGPAAFGPISWRPMGTGMMANTITATTVHDPGIEVGNLTPEAFIVEEQPLPPLRRTYDPPRPWTPENDNE